MLRRVAISVDHVPEFVLGHAAPLAAQDSHDIGDPIGHEGGSLAGRHGGLGEGLRPFRPTWVRHGWRRIEWRNP